MGKKTLAAARTDPLSRGMAVDPFDENRCCNCGPWKEDGCCAWCCACCNLASTNATIAVGLVTGIVVVALMCAVVVLAGGYVTPPQ